MTKVVLSERGAPPSPPPRWVPSGRQRPRRPEGPKRVASSAEEPWRSMMDGRNFLLRSSAPYWLLFHVFVVSISSSPSSPLGSRGPARGRDGKSSTLALTHSPKGRDSLNSLRLSHEKFIARTHSPPFANCSRLWLALFLQGPTERTGSPSIRDLPFASLSPRPTSTTAIRRTLESPALEVLSRTTDGGRDGRIDGLLPKGGKERVTRNGRRGGPHRRARAWAILLSDGATIRIRSASPKLVRGLSLAHIRRRRRMNVTSPRMARSRPQRGEEALGS